MAEAVTVLNANEETLALAAADAGVTISHPMEHVNENSLTSGKVPAANVIEIV